MTTEIAELILKADTTDIKAADAALDRLDKTGKRTEKSTKSLEAQIEKMNADISRQEAIVGLTKDQIALYDAAMKGATKSELESIKAIQERAAKLDASARAVKEKQAAEVSAAAAQKKAAAAALKEKEAADRKAAAAAAALEANTKKINDEIARQEAIVGLTKDEIALYDAATRGATKSQLEALKAAQKRASALKASNDAVVLNTKAMRGNRFAVQNAAFQFQDLAVQMEMGVAPSRALAQQIPQLLGGFGAVGAVTGLVAGLAFTLAGPLVDGLFSASEATKDLEGDIKDLHENIEDLHEAQKAYLIDLKIDEIEKQEKKISKLNKSLKEQEALMGRATGAKEITRASVVYTTFDTGAVQSEITELRSAAVTAEQQLEGLNSELERLRGGTGAIDPKENQKRLDDELDALLNNAIREEELLNQSVEQYEKAQDRKAEASKKSRDKEAQSLIDAAIKDEQAVNDSVYKFEEGVRRRIAILSSSSMTEREVYSARLSYVQDALNAEIISNEEAAAAITAIRDRAAKQDAQIAQQANQNVLSAQLSFAAQMSSILQSSSDENSDLAKAGYAIAQGVQVAQAINSANVAYANVLATIPAISDPTGTLQASTIARAETTRSLGYASAALIAGNAIGNLAGRAQGGQVRPGQAYRVGEYGPETLVMGSNGGTVTPNTSGPNIQVLANVQVIGGANDAEVTTSTTQISEEKFIVNVMVDQLSNTSSRSRKALSQTSNLTNKGSR